MNRQYKLLVFFSSIHDWLPILYTHKSPISLCSTTHEVYSKKQHRVVFSLVENQFQVGKKKKQLGEQRNPKSKISPYIK